VKIFDYLLSVMIADDMLVLDVLNSLVNAPSKTSKLEIKVPSGQLLFDTFILLFHIICYLSHVGCFLWISLLSTDPGSHGKTDSVLSDRREKGQPTIDLSKLGKAIGKSSASKTGKKRHKKLLDAEVRFSFLYFLQCTSSLLVDLFRK